METNVRNRHRLPSYRALSGDGAAGTEKALQAGRGRYIRPWTHEGEAFHYRGRHRHPHSQGPMRTWQESRSIGE